MIHSRRNNYIIRNLHERCLIRLTYNNKNSSYEELLTKDGPVCIPQRNIQAFVIEFYKIKNGLSPELFTETFARSTEFHYNLRRCNDFRIPSISTIHHGDESISFLEPKIWNILLDKIEQQTSLKSFKKSVKKCTHKIVHADCAKFILKVSVCFLSCHKYREILLCVSYLLFFHSKDIDLFTFSTLTSRIDIAVLTLNMKMPAGSFNSFYCFNLFYP